MRPITPLLALILVLAPITTALAPSGAPGPADRLQQVARAAGYQAPSASPVEAGTAFDEVRTFYTLVGAQPTEQGLDTLGTGLADLPPGVQSSLARILAAMNQATLMRHQALAGLTAEDAAFAREATLAPGGLSDAETARLTSLLPAIDLPLMLQASDLVLTTLETETPSLRALGKTQTAESVGFVDPLGAIEVAGSGDDVHAEDRTLLIDLGGNDTWENNAGATFPDVVIQAFPGCITTGGLDCTPLAKQRNEPALESVFGRPCGAEVPGPLFRGIGYLAQVDGHVDDQTSQPSVPALTGFLTGTTPEAAGEAAAKTDPETRCLPQGPDDVGPWSEAFFERGILTDGDEHVVAVGLDLSGDDRFAPPKVFNAINNGHNAAGCDTTDMGEEGKLWSRNLTAGSAFTGIGILWDEDGADFYGGRSLSQGVGHVGAVGVLVDRGADDDHYVGVRIDQGAGLFAAAGLLYDDGGDDLYELKNDVPYFNEFEHFVGCDVSTRDGQGRANFNAIGALVDEAGDDIYDVQVHDEDVPGASRDDPTTTQGSTGARLNIGPDPVNGAAALGAGLLWDADGHDTYSRPDRANDHLDPQGTFWDTSTEE